MRIMVLMLLACCLFWTTWLFAAILFYSTFNCSIDPFNILQYPYSFLRNIGIHSPRIHFLRYWIGVSGAYHYGLCWNRVFDFVSKSLSGVAFGCCMALIGYDSALSMWHFSRHSWNHLTPQYFPMNIIWKTVETRRTINLLSKMLHHFSIISIKFSSSTFAFGLIVSITHLCIVKASS